MIKISEERLFHSYENSIVQNVRKFIKYRLTEISLNKKIKYPIILTVYGKKITLPFKWDNFFPSSCWFRTFMCLYSFSSIFCFTGITGGMSLSWSASKRFYSSPASKRFYWSPVSKPFKCSLVKMYKSLSKAHFQLPQFITENWCRSWFL